METNLPRLNVGRLVICGQEVLEDGRHSFAGVLGGRFAMEAEEQVGQKKSSQTRWDEIGKANQSASSRDRQSLFPNSNFIIGVIRPPNPPPFS